MSKLIYMLKLHKYSMRNLSIDFFSKKYSFIMTTMQLVFFFFHVSAGLSLWSIVACRCGQYANLKIVTPTIYVYVKN